MWPRTVDWEELRFGVEIEFVGGNPAAVGLLPGWVMALDELQVDDTGEDSGAELKPPPLLWRGRDQIRVMLDRLKATGAGPTGAAGCTCTWDWSRGGRTSCSRWSTRPSRTRTPCAGSCGRPQSHRDRAWLEDALVPVLEPLVRSRVPEAEILAIRPVPGGFRVTAEEPGDRRTAFLTRPGPDGWSLEPLESERG